jgi:hypothetical protein
VLRFAPLDRGFWIWLNGEPVYDAYLLAETQRDEIFERHIRHAALPGSRKHLRGCEWSGLHNHYYRCWEALKLGVINPNT